jgi:glycosyltransferase involved in cell wall biosynthesis
MRIAIDARAMTHPQPGGYRRYCRGLVETLLCDFPEHRYELLTDRPLDASDPLTRSGVEVRTIRSAGGPPAVVLREQAMLPLYMRRSATDLWHFPTGTAPLLAGRGAIVTIHDAIQHLEPSISRWSKPLPGTRFWWMRQYDRICQRAVAKRASLVLTVSEHSRSDIARCLQVPVERIRVTHLAPAQGFRRLQHDEASRGEASKWGSFILAVGSADPRKNLDLLVQAYARLPSGLIDRYRLVVVWTHPVLSGRVWRLAEAEGVRDRILTVFGPSDEELCRLYNLATLFVFPSQYEGFGLPPLEAMACGTPVIAAKTSSVPEVLGDAALYTDPQSVGDLSRLLSRCLTDWALQVQYAARGLERVKRFSWNRTARQTMEAYEEAIPRKRCPNERESQPAV